MQQLLQGSDLFVILFPLFTIDLPNPILGLNHIKILQYSDNLILYTLTKNISLNEPGLNSYLDQLYRHFTHWKLFLNPQNCQTIVFRGGTRMPLKIRKDIAILSHKFHETPILTTNEVTYLGVTMNSRFVYKSLDSVLKFSRLSFPVANSLPELSSFLALSSDPIFPVSNRDAPRTKNPTAVL